MRLRVIRQLALLLLWAGSPRPASAVWNIDWENQIKHGYGPTFVYAESIGDDFLSNEPAGAVRKDFELGNDGNGNPLLFMEARESDQFIGAHASAYARMEGSSLSEVPKLKISVEAAAPVRP